MSWPLASHFSATLQNPKIAFRDSQLQQCRIEKDQRNQPRPWAGAFAVVYKAIDAKRAEPFAVRVFTTESPERRERYEVISEYLCGRRLDCLVGFEYRDRGIRSAGDGKWYPMILMEWVEGQTLLQWVRARCLEGNTSALAAAAGRWVAVVQELAQASIAHGDLQHANVMVTAGGELRLVDYDCMCVPALVGRRNLEVGVEPYQHPDRNQATLLSPDLDNFSALTIHVALRALAADPQLWLKHVERAGYDKLLLRKEDFRAPPQSALYHDLVHSPDKDVRELAEQVFSLFGVPMDRVPPLSHLADSFRKVEELLHRKQWTAAVEALNRRGQFRDAPEHLKPLIREAYEHVCRERAWKAFKKVKPKISEPSDRKLIDAWNETLFAGYQPAEKARIRVAEARRRVSVVDGLYHLVQRAEQLGHGSRSSDGKVTLAGEQRIVDAASKLPQGYRHSLSARVEQARRRVRTIARLLEVLAEPVVEASVVAAWRAVEAAECEGLVDAAWHPRIELARQRATVIKALDEIDDKDSADLRDRHVLDLWREDLLAECREADRWRPAYETAVSRRELLRRLQHAVDGENEAAVGELMEAPCLSDYPLPAEWGPAARRTQQRISRTEAMLAALRAGQPSAFRESFDAAIIRGAAERFARHEPLLRQWIPAEILPPERLGLKPVSGRKCLLKVRDAEGDHRARWTWPQPRFADQCLLAVCPQQPGPADDPVQLSVHRRWPVGHQSWEDGGGSWLIRTESGWAGGYVVVWAVVDVGFHAFYSPPLVLGRLGTASRWSWRALPIFSSPRGDDPRPGNENADR